MYVQKPVHVRNRHLPKMFSFNHWPIEYANVGINYLILAPPRQPRDSQSLFSGKTSYDRVSCDNFVRHSSVAKHRNTGGLGPRKSQYKMAETSGNLVETG